MTLTINIADDKWPRVRDGVCLATGYAGDGTNPDKKNHVERFLKKALKDITINQEAKAAAEAAAAAHLAAAGGTLDLG